MHGRWYFDRAHIWKCLPDRRVTYPMDDRLTSNVKSYQPQDFNSVDHRWVYTFYPLEAYVCWAKLMASSAIESWFVDLWWGWGVVRDCGVSGDSGQPSIWARTRAVYLAYTLPSLPCGDVYPTRLRVERRCIGVQTSVDTLRCEPLAHWKIVENLRPLKHVWSFEKYFDLGL